MAAAQSLSGGHDIDRSYVVPRLIPPWLSRKDFAHGAVGAALYQEIGGGGGNGGGGYGTATEVVGHMVKVKVKVLLTDALGNRCHLGAGGIDDVALVVEHEGNDVDFVVVQGCLSLGTGGDGAGVGACDLVAGLVGRTDALGGVSAGGAVGGAYHHVVEDEADVLLAIFPAGEEFGEARHLGQDVEGAGLGNLIGVGLLPEASLAGQTVGREDEGHGVFRHVAEEFDVGGAVHFRVVVGNHAADAHVHGRGNLALFLHVEVDTEVGGAVVRVGGDFAVYLTHRCGAESEAGVAGAVHGVGGVVLMQGDADEAVGVGGVEIVHGVPSAGAVAAGRAGVFFHYGAVAGPARIDGQREGLCGRYGFESLTVYAGDAQRGGVVAVGALGRNGNEGGSLLVEAGFQGLVQRDGARAHGFAHRQAVVKAADALLAVAHEVHLKLSLLILNDGVVYHAVKAQSVVGQRVGLHHELYAHGAVVLAPVEPLAFEASPVAAIRHVGPVGDAEAHHVLHVSVGDIHARGVQLLRRVEGHVVPAHRNLCGHLAVDFSLRVFVERHLFHLRVGGHAEAYAYGLAVCQLFVEAAFDVGGHGDVALVGGGARGVARVARAVAQEVLVLAEREVLVLSLGLHRTAAEGQQTKEDGETFTHSHS